MSTMAAGRLRARKDLHRKLMRADNLDEILAWREQRTGMRNRSQLYDRMMLLLAPTPWRAVRQARRSRR